MELYKEKLAAKEEKTNELEELLESKEVDLTNMRNDLEAMEKERDDLDSTLVDLRTELGEKELILVQLESKQNENKEVEEKLAELQNTNDQTIKQLNEKGIDTHAYGIFLNLYSLNGIFRFIYRLVYGLSKKANSAKLSFYPDWVSGSFMLIKRKDFIRIGGWDENFWMYYEDMDICKRAKKHGFTFLLALKSSKNMYVF